jgi:hypothetical protein
MHWTSLVVLDHHAPNFEIGLALGGLLGLALAGCRYWRGAHSGDVGGPASGPWLQDRLTLGPRGNQFALALAC